MKVAIVVLILVAVLFAVALGLGFRKEPSASSQREKAEKGDSPGWTDAFKKAADSRMPKIHLKKTRLEVPSADSTIVIEACPEPCHDPFRMLKLAYDGGSEVQVEFHSKKPPPKMGGSGGEMDDPQKFTLIPGEKSDHENHRFPRSSVVVFKSGGTLKLTVKSGAGGSTGKGYVKVERRPTPWTFRPSTP